MRSTASVGGGRSPLSFDIHRMAVIDRKGVWTFLALTFGLTFVYEGCLIGSA